MKRNAEVIESINVPTSEDQGNSDVRTLAKGASVSFIGKFAGRGFHVAGQVLIARLLGPGAFGLYALGWTILRLVGVIAPLGLDKGVIRFATPHWRTDTTRFRRVALQSIGLAIFTGLMVGAVLFVAAPWLAEEVFRKPDLTLVFRGFALAFPLMAGMQVSAATTRISQQMQYSAYAEHMAQPLANVILFVIFYAVGWHLFGAVAAGALSFGVAFIVAVFYVRQIFPEVFSFQNVPNLLDGGRKLLYFSVPTAFAGMFYALILWTDRLLIGYFQPASEVGIYQAASQSSFMFTMILSALNTIFTPMIADLYGERKLDRLEELYRISTKWGLYLCLPMFLVVLFAPEDIMNVVFGRQYIPGATPMVILGIAQLFNVATGAVGFLLIMTGRQNEWFVISGSMLLVNIVLNIFLIPTLGSIGAALSTTTAVVGLFVVGLTRVKQSLGLWPYDRRYLKGFAATLLTSVAMGALLYVIPVHIPLVVLILLSIMSAGVFAIVLYALGLDEEDIEFMYLIRNRLRRQLGLAKLS